MQKEYLKFLWWNTSLSHKNRQNAHNEDKIIIWRVINDLIKNYTFDVLVLSEIREDDVKDIIKYCKLVGYYIEYECLKVGKTWFDMCIIYKSTINLVSKKAIHATKLNNTHKIGVEFNLNLFTDINIHLFASHWPSQLQQNSIDKRISNAQILREKIDDIISTYEELDAGDPHIILMGDFNDEPFEKSISYHLQSSRDELLVKNNKKLFFNPFWGELSRKNNNANIGTCYYKSGDLTKWKTFDQIMYSHAFIKDKDNNLSLIYSDDKIFVTKYLLDAILSRESKLDHLPVFGIIEKQT